MTLLLELVYGTFNANFYRVDDFKRIMFVPPFHSQLRVISVDRCTSPDSGYIWENSTWWDATGSPSLLKIKNLVLVVPWSIEPIKDSWLDTDTKDSWLETELWSPILIMLLFADKLAKTSGFCSHGGRGLYGAKHLELLARTNILHILSMWCFNGPPTQYIDLVNLSGLYWRSGVNSANILRPSKSSLSWYWPTDWLTSVTLRYHSYQNLHIEWLIHSDVRMFDTIVPFDLCRQYLQGSEMNWTNILADGLTSPRTRRKVCLWVRGHNPSQNTQGCSEISIKNEGWCLHSTTDAGRYIGVKNSDNYPHWGLLPSRISRTTLVFPSCLGRHRHTAFVDTTRWC